VKSGERLSTDDKAAECHRCSKLIAQGRVRAVLYDVSLCVDCWNAWREFGGKAFRLWLGETDWYDEIKPEGKGGA